MIIGDVLAQVFKCSIVFAERGTVSSESIGNENVQRIVELHYNATLASCVVARFLDDSPDGLVYAVMCFLVRFVEALGAAAFLTASFAIIANTFPDRVATMFVRTASRIVTTWQVVHITVHAID